MLCLIFCLFLPPVNAGGIAIYGDIDVDNAVTVGDALPVLQKTVGKTDLTEEQSVVADVDREKNNSEQCYADITVCGEEDKRVPC